MVDFVRQRTAKTPDPQVIVDAGLPTGKHRFQLVVVDAQGNQSKPAEVTVTVTQIVGPVILDPRIGGGVLGPS